MKPKAQNPQRRCNIVNFKTKTPQSTKPHNHLIVIPSSPDTRVHAYVSARRPAAALYHCVPLRAQSTQPLLQLILLLSRWLIRHGRLRLCSSGCSLAELLAELETGIVGELTEEFVDGVLADLGRGGLSDCVLVDAVGHGVFFVLLAELLEGTEGLLKVHCVR